MNRKHPWSDTLRDDKLSGKYWCFTLYKIYPLLCSLNVLFMGCRFSGFIEGLTNTKGQIVWRNTHAIYTEYILAIYLRCVIYEFILGKHPLYIVYKFSTTYDHMYLPIDINLYIWRMINMRYEGSQRYLNRDEWKV